MNATLDVTPGVDMTSAMHLLNGGRLHKDWLRDYLRTNPQKDFRLVGRTSYVNGAEALENDLTLNVVNHDGMHVAYVDFQVDDSNEWGYKAVVS